MSLNVSGHMGGDYMTHKNLILPCQVLIITTATEEIVGDEKKPKICIGFSEYPTKKLALNKTNLGRIVDLYGMNAEAWLRRSLQVYRCRTEYSGKSMLCIRVCGPSETPHEPVLDLEGNLVDLTPQAPVAPPQAIDWPPEEEEDPPSA